MSDAAAHSPHRRLFLTGALLLTAAASTGALWLGFRPESRELWVERALRKHLPGVDLDPASLASFAASFVQSHEFDDRRMEIAVWMDQAMPAIARRIEKAERRIAQLERAVVSDYLLGSNFFRVADPRAETIIYSAALPACGNPFAVFRDQ
jgi:hypothetical protein